MTASYTAAATAAAALLAAAAVWAATSKKRIKTQKSVAIRPRWKRVGRVERLLIYPLKSGQPVDVDSGMMLRGGMEAGLGEGRVLRDRSFMVVDADNWCYFDVRSTPKLIRLKVDGAGTGDR